MADSCRCNSPSLIHPEDRVPLAFCRDRCPFPERPGIRGAGDLVAAGLKIVGITKPRVRKITGGDCGCDKRQKTLNDAVRFAGHPLKPGITKWAVGITAAPRPVSTLAETVRTMADSGWCDPLVFAEPGTDVVPGCRWIQRPETIAPLVFDGDELEPESGRFGAHQNFVQTLADLLEAFPDADAILYVQDDVRFAKGIRDFIERDLWPSQRTGLVSLYCPNFKGYRSPKPQLKRIRQTHLMGGLAYVIPRHVAELMVSHPLARSWKGGVTCTIDIPWKRKALDGFAGQVLTKLNLRSYFYSPSVVEHFHPADSPKNSAVGHGSAEGKRKEFRFIGPGVRMDDIFQPGWMRWTLATPADHASGGGNVQRFPKRPKLSRDPIHVILPFCGLPDLTVRCLESLERSQGVKLHVAAIDNGSTIDESHQVRDWLSASGLSHRFIRNNRNEGFTLAVNQGLAAAAAGSHVLIINNDARVSRDCLKTLKLHLEWHPKTASVCPLTNDRGRCSVRVDANRWNSGLDSDAVAAILAGDMSPDAVQQLLTRVHVADLPVLPWFCCLLHRDAVAAVSQLPDAGALKSGLAVDDWWSKQLTRRGWMNLVCYDAYAEHDHQTTFQALGIDRKPLQKAAVRQLRKLARA